MLLFFIVWQLLCRLIEVPHFDLRAHDHMRIALLLLRPVGQMVFHRSGLDGARGARQSQGFIQTKCFGNILLTQRRKTGRHGPDTRSTGLPYIPF